jgi:hypothetical protein
MLALVGDRLSYRTRDGVVFDVPLSEVTDFACPWYYFVASFKFKISGKTYACVFTKLNVGEYQIAREAARTAFGTLAFSGVGLVGAAMELRDFKRARAYCRPWKFRLEGRSRGSSPASAGGGLDPLSVPRAPDPGSIQFFDASGTAGGTFQQDESITWVAQTGRVEFMPIRVSLSRILPNGTIEELTNLQVEGADPMAFNIRGDLRIEDMGALNLTLPGHYLVQYFRGKRRTAAGKFALL